MTEGYVWSDAQIGKWLRHVVNVKQLQERSRGLVVRVMSTSRQAAFCYVQSGSDESVWYSVRVWNDARGLLHTRCSCPWGQHRPKESPECACSHVMAAMEALAGLVGRSLSFWLDVTTLPAKAGSFSGSTHGPTAHVSARRPGPGPERRFSLVR